MANKQNVFEWVDYAKTDLTVAQHLYEHLRPMPSAVICYHAEQCAEKILKALLAAYDVEIRKTHDLGNLAEELAQYRSIEDHLIDLCYDLTPYGVKSRYPEELRIDEQNASDALKAASFIFEQLYSALPDIFHDETLPQ